MKDGPPGMSIERWNLYRKEVAFKNGDPVNLTSKEVAMLELEAYDLVSFFAEEELKKL